MAAPLGNKNGRGAKGRSGRKSAYQELADAKRLRDMFFVDQDQDKIERKIGKGKFALKDRFVLNGMEGDSRVLNKLIDKLFPDGIDVAVDARLTVAFDPTFDAATRKAKGNS